MSEKTVWVSFDFDLRGDYTGIYAWLDKYGAKECSPYLATLKYSGNGDFVDKIEQEIKRCVKLTEQDRVYIIWKEEETGKIKGKFINGGRKRARWHGYGTADLAQTEDE